MLSPAEERLLAAQVRTKIRDGVESTQDSVETDLVEDMEWSPPSIEVSDRQWLLHAFVEGTIRYKQASATTPHGAARLARASASDDPVDTRTLRDGDG